MASISRRLRRRLAPALPAIGAVAAIMLGLAIVEPPVGAAAAEPVES